MHVEIIFLLHQTIMMSVPTLRQKNFLILYPILNKDQDILFLELDIPIILNFPLLNASSSVALGEMEMCGCMEVM